MNRIQRDALKNGILKGELKVAEQFKTDEELSSARSLFTKVQYFFLESFAFQEFYELFEKGFKLYING